MRPTTYAFALLAALAALAIAGCGGSSGSGSESSSETASSGGGYGGNSSAAKPVEAAPNAEEGTTFVSLGDAGELGMVLVDSKGMTLYEFDKDQGSESNCNGPCAEAWPPLLTEGEPEPSNGTSASMLGTTERKDGTTQVTYAGHPLYGFVEDKKPGEANGNDATAFGARWHALTSGGEVPGSSGGGETSSEETGAASPSPGGY